MPKILLIKTDTTVSWFNAYAWVFSDEIKLKEAFRSEVLEFRDLFGDGELSKMLTQALEEWRRFSIKKSDHEFSLSNTHFYYYQEDGEHVTVNIRDVEDNVLFDLDEYA